MTLGPDDQEPTPDSPDDEAAEEDTAEPVVDDLDADTEGDGSALCVSLCWSPPTDEGTTP